MNIINKHHLENPPDINISPKYIQGNITFNLNIEVLTTKMIWDHAVVFKMQTDFIGYINIQNDLEVFIDIGNFKIKYDFNLLNIF